MYIHVVYIIVHPYTRNARLLIPWDPVLRPVIRWRSTQLVLWQPVGPQWSGWVREYESTRDESTTGIFFQAVYYSNDIHLLILGFTRWFTWSYTYFHVVSNGLAMFFFADCSWSEDVSIAFRWSYSLQIKRLRGAAYGELNRKGQRDTRFRLNEST